MAGIALQQQLKRNSSGRDGSWKDYSNHWSSHVSYGEKESKRTIFDYRAVIDVIELEIRIRKVVAFCLHRAVQRTAGHET